MKINLRAQISDPEFRKIVTETSERDGAFRFENFLSKFGPRTSLGFEIRIFL